MRSHIFIIACTLLVSATAKADTHSIALVPLYTGAERLDYGLLLASTLSSRVQVVAHSQLKHLFQQAGWVFAQEIPALRAQSIKKHAKEGEELVYMDPSAAMAFLSRAKIEGANLSEAFLFDEDLKGTMQKVYLLLAWVYILSGQDSEAEAVMKEALLLFGTDMPVTEREYHPRLVEFFRNVRDKLLEGERCKVHLTADSEDCSFQLDGNPVTPGTGDLQVLCGTHYVRALCGEKKSMIHKFSAGHSEEPTNVVINVALDSALVVHDNTVSIGVENIQEIEDFLTMTARLLAQATKTDQLLFYGVFSVDRKKELRAWLVDTKSSTIIAKASVEVPEDVISVSAANSLCEMLIPPKMKETEVAARTVSQKKTPWFKNYYGYIATAVGIGGIIAGAFFWQSYQHYKSIAEDPHYKTNDGLGSWEEYEYKLRERDKAYSRRTLAYICFGVGSASVASGFLLFLFTDKLMPAQIASDGSTITLSLDF